MANLSLKTKIKYVPSLPGNKELSEPLSFSVTAGLSVMENRRWRDLLQAINFDGTDGEIVSGLNSAFEGIAEINGSHTIDEKQIKSVGDYLVLVGLQPGAPLMTELMEFISYHNSAGGLKEVFCVRSFGGTPTTPEGKK
jgi:hypothetical protein